MKIALFYNVLFCLGVCSLAAPQWPGIGSSGYGFAPWAGYGNYGSSSASVAASSSSSSSGGFLGYGTQGYGYGWPGYGYGYGNYGGGYQQQYNQYQYSGYNNYGSGNGLGYPFGYGR
ncbi:glycine-rich protein [Drosophila virilis]|uniref:glycine-rich protein n=1 Tax=Drosophila virilis TaxID=7244 RepID=UPI00017D4AFD|nr:keratin-associated protein 6-2 [Drosophila virilis]